MKPSTKEPAKESAGHAVDRRSFLKVAAALSGAIAVGAAEGRECDAAGPSTGSESDPVYLADLSICEPASALTRKPRRHRWRLLDYETETLKGTMLVAGQNTQAPEIALPLNTSGWHAVWIGVRAVYGPTRLQVRLTSDSTFSMITHAERREDRNRIVDLFWKSADLTGQKLVLRQFTLQIDSEHPDSVANPSDAAWVAYVKLVPLSTEEVTTLKAERKYDFRHLRFGGELHGEVSHRRLFAHNDAWSYTYTYRPTTEAEIRRELEPFRDTDFSRIYWEAASGDRTRYPSKIGRMSTNEWVEDPYRVGDRLANESWREFAREGIDPLLVAVDYAHEIGLEFHAAYRTAGFHFPVPEDEWTAGGLYDQHPEWHGRDRQGRPTPRLSYAYPEVREFVATLLIKIVDRYPIDGVCLLFNRRPPLLDYEPPLVEGFQQKFGEDPRRLDERDPRWLAYRATFLTQFMRRLRELIGSRSRMILPKVSAIVMSSEAENLYFAMDVETWVREGLVDTLIPYTSVKRLDSSRDSWLDPADAEFFLRITQGARCKLALNLMPRQLSPEEYRARAQRLYAAGVEDLFFWDTNARNDYSPSWTALRRLGHREELDAWVAAGSEPLERPGTELKKLGDWDLSYDTPG